MNAIRRMGLLVGLGLLLLATAGCLGHANVELAAADALDAIAVETQHALEEYRSDLSSGDNAREGDAINAFVARTQRDHADEAKMNGHVAEFITALARLRQDRDTAEQRFRLASDNVGLLRETSSGLRRLSVESLRLDDETRRYFGALLQARNRAAAAPTSPAPPTAAAPALSSAPPGGQTSASPAAPPPGN